MSDTKTAMVGGTWLGGMKLTAKIYVAFAVVLLLLALLAAASIIGLRSTGSDFTDYEGLARQHNAVSKVKSALLFARVAVKDFVIEGDSDSAAAVQTAIGRMQDAASGASALIEDQEVAAEMADILDLFQEYAATFDTVTKLQERRAQLVADVIDRVGPVVSEKLTKITDAAHEDRDFIGAYHSGRAQERYLLANVYVQKFLVGGRSSDSESALRYLKEAEGLFANLTDALKYSDLLGMAEEATSDYQSYRAAFEEIASIVVRQNELIRTGFDRIGPEMASRLDRIDHMLSEHQDQLGENASRTISSTVSSSWILAIVSVILGLLAAFAIGRSVSRPIVRMTEAMAAWRRATRMSRSLDRIATTRLATWPGPSRCSRTTRSRWSA